MSSKIKAGISEMLTDWKQGAAKRHDNWLKAVSTLGLSLGASIPVSITAAFIAYLGGSPTLIKIGCIATMLYEICVCAYYSNELLNNTSAVTHWKELPRFLLGFLIIGSLGIVLSLYHIFNTSLLPSVQEGPHPSEYFKRSDDELKRDEAFRQHLKDLTSPSARLQQRHMLKWISTLGLSLGASISISITAAFIARLGGSPTLIVIGCIVIMVSVAYSYFYYENIIKKEIYEYDNYEYDKIINEKSILYLLSRM